MGSRKSGLVAGSAPNCKRGGIYAQGESNVTFINSTLSANSTDGSAGGGGGGGFVAREAILRLNNTTVSKNTSSTEGGGVYVDGGSLSLTNSILSGNYAELFIGAEVAVSDTASLTSTSSILGDSSHTVGQAFSGFSPSSTDINATSTEDGVSIFIPTAVSSIIGLLSDNGGDTFTHALPEGSPAIDAGNNTNCGSGLTVETDQRDEPRADGLCDIGSYEFDSQADSGFFVIPLANGKVVVIPE